MSNKNTMFNMRISTIEKNALQLIARNQGKSLGNFFLDSAKFYGRIPKGFIEEFEKVADGTGLHPVDFIVHFLQAKVAAAAAWQETFGAAPPGFLRGFKWDDKGKLITGNKLSEMLKDEYLEIFQKLKSDLQKSADDNEPVTISRESMSEYAAQL